MYTKMKKEIDTARNIMSNHAQKKLDDVTADKSRLDNELEVWLSDEDRLIGSGYAARG